MKTFLYAVAVIPILLAYGCATPQSRIKRNPELFEQFPHEVRKKIREGRIDTGFTKDMVWMALGQPDRMYTKRENGQTSEIWTYVQQYSTGRIDPYWPHYQTYGYTYDDRYYYHRVPVYYNQPWIRQREFETLRVEFQEEAVVSIEELQRHPGYKPDEPDTAENSNTPDR